MISDDKPTSPIARSTEYISIEESEFGSIDYEDDSISESLQDNTVPSFEVFLKIKPSTKKAEFFDTIMKQRINDFLNGHNSTIMSFGTTNSGKTYTLHGTPEQPDFEEPVKSRPLKLIGDKNGQAYVHGLTTIYVTTPFEACQILIAGQSRMSSSFTNLNPRSSRSHTIFTIGLLKYQKAYAPHETEASTLTFCDLAGSGRSKGLGENIERLQEAKNINKSLLRSEKLKDFNVHTTRTNETNEIRHELKSLNDTKTIHSLEQNSTIRDESFNTNLNIDDRIDSNDNEINELKKQLSEKTMNVEILQLQLKSCERTLNDRDNAWKDAENKNLNLLKKIESLENVIKVMECDRKNLTKPKSPFYLEEVSSSPLDDKINCQIDKNHLRLSSIMENSFFCDDSNEPQEFVVQAHVDIKKNKFKNIGKKGFIGKDCSNVMEMDTKNILEISGNDLRQSNASSKNDSGIMIDESFDNKNCYSSINSDKSICDKKELNEIEKFINAHLSKEIQFEENDNELKENFQLNDDNEFVRMKCYEFLTCKCQCLEDLLKWIKKKRDLQKEYCKTEHLLKLDELRKELSLKTQEIDQANEQISLANRDLNKLQDLMKRLNDLMIVTADFQKNNNDLYDELRKRKEIQLSLETKLKYLVTLMEAKEDEIKHMKDNITMIFQDNTGNNDKSKDLGLRIIEIKERLNSIKEELIDSERKHLNEKNEELIEMRSQLNRKEDEMNWFKTNRDSTIKRYEYLVKQLQDEIEKFKEQSRLETSELKEINRNSSVVRTSNKFKVSESLKKLTRVGRNSDGSWRKPNYLRKKSIDDKSLGSTSNFSVKRATSSNETIVESMKENNPQLKRYNESICQLPIDEDQMLTSQTESDVDSYESYDSRVDTTTESSTKTNYYDSEDSDENSFRIKRNRMTGWMRIRRIDGRTVLPSCSEFHLEDSDISDS
ncbi:PREDICTED: kinesin-like protein KIF20B [Polistes dominula]|uniref:Kinesin-like protein KIF20B n=1 Tax=Polistes dominula TaxID=743375 RepID=A0ABM1IA84_POLDO|nr:PREDICTED: kinesin-like protein KIF20B [Polistes dominula]